MLKLRTKGIPVNIEEVLVGRITRNQNNVNNESILIKEYETNDPELFNGLAIITNQTQVNSESKDKIVFKVPSLDHLSEGDLISIGVDGNINTLYRINSNQNTLLATNRCNSNCIMCSQPPKDKDDVERLYAIYKKLIPMIPKDCPELGISGGEPTLMGELFFNLLEQIKTELPETDVHVLTNGRTFAWDNMAERLSQIGLNRMMLGIPVYSDYYQVHDYIVQAKNAFNQTILGLHNLSRYDQRIEIRVVLHKQSIPRLAKLARYIYKNLPFAEHVTFMGLEFIGYTPHNIEKLWIDPHDYVAELSEAVLFLSSQGMNVSIYNSQLCVLPENLWPYMRKSISDWKNDFLPECNSCSKLNDCGGLFTWNLEKHSNYIKPIL